MIFAILHFFNLNFWKFFAQLSQVIIQDFMIFIPVTYPRNTVFKLHLVQEILLQKISGLCRTANAYRQDKLLDIPEATNKLG